MSEEFDPIQAKQELRKLDATWLGFPRRMWIVLAVVILMIIAGMTLPLLVLHTLDNTSKKAAVAAIKAANNQQVTQLLTVQAAKNCASVNDLRHTLAVLVLSSTKTLGKKGTAGYDYYRTHPAELQSAIRQSEKTAKVTLAPKPCLIKEKK